MLFDRGFTPLAVLMALVLCSSCLQDKPQATAPVAKPAEEKKPAAVKAPEAVDKEEIVFDPRKPPPGYVNCHRNHCHKVGGGIASYAQVMEEIGATKLVGAPKMGPMPPAPADVAAPPADAVVAESGLTSKVLKPGDGQSKPGPKSIATVHFTAWTTEGKAIDSSVARGTPATMPIARTLPGLSEGLQLMSIGEERRFWIPENLAFQGKPGKPAGTIVFDMELIEIN